MGIVSPSMLSGFDLEPGGVHMRACRLAGGTLAQEDDVGDDARSLRA